MTNPETIRCTKQDGILTMTLHRPERLNAFTPLMMCEMVAALDDGDADDSIRAVIVTGEGRAFCAGADRSAGSATFDYENRADKDGVSNPVRADGTIDYANEAVRDLGGVLALRLFRNLKPLIAAVNGPAVGVGATMLLPMDIRLASEAARFGFVFARRGIVPESASAWFLPRVVGVSTALEWTMTGRIFGAEEARHAGMIRSVHPAGDLLPAAIAIAREVIDNTAPVSVALTRQMIWRGLTVDEPMEIHKLDSRAIYSRGRSADAREGIASFLDKRAPHYPDKVSRDLPDFYPWWTEREYG